MKILQRIITIISLMFFGTTIANSLTTIPNTSARACQTLICVRKNIDVIDTKIVGQCTFEWVKISLSWQKSCQDFQF